MAEESGQTQHEATHAAAPTGTTPPAGAPAAAPFDDTMLQVANVTPQLVGNVTVEPTTEVKDSARVTGPSVNMAPVTVDMQPNANLAAGEVIQVGPVQT